MGTSGVLSTSVSVALAIPASSRGWTGDDPRPLLSYTPLIHHAMPDAWLCRVSVMVGTVPRATIYPLSTASILPAQDWGWCTVQEQLEPHFCGLGREVSLPQPHIPLQQPGLGQEPPPWSAHATRSPGPDGSTG